MVNNDMSAGGGPASIALGGDVAGATHGVVSNVIRDTFPDKTAVKKNKVKPKTLENMKDNLVATGTGSINCASISPPCTKIL